LTTDRLDPVRDAIVEALRTGDRPDLLAALCLKASAEVTILSRAMDRADFVELSGRMWDQALQEFVRRGVPVMVSANTVSE
jgi:hypothetical protein